MCCQRTLLAQADVEALRPQQHDDDDDDDDDDEGDQYWNLSVAIGRADPLPDLEPLD
jgi:hypothetical protein